MSKILFKGSMYDKQMKKLFEMGSVGIISSEFAEVFLHRELAGRGHMLSK